MRPQDVIIGESYRHHSTPNYGYAKVIKILNPKEAPNTHTYKIVKCEWSVQRDDVFRMIKYFRPCDLDKLKE